MSDQNSLEHLSRRELVMGAGLLALLGLQDATAAGPRGELSEAEQAALEKANDKLVADFVRDYSSRDATVLDKYVADDVIYQITEGMAEIVGREAFFNHNDRMFKGLNEVEWINRRQFAIGQLAFGNRLAPVAKSIARKQFVFHDAPGDVPFSRRVDPGVETGHTTEIDLNFVRMLRFLF